MRGEKSAGLLLSGGISPASAAALRFGWLGRTMSSRRAGIPALAKWAAMRAPMVPAPSTATRRSGVIGYPHGVYQNRCGAVGPVFKVIL